MQHNSASPLLSNVAECSPFRSQSCWPSLRWSRGCRCRTCSLERHVQPACGAGMMAHYSTWNRNRIRLFDDQWSGFTVELFGQQKRSDMKRVWIESTCDLVHLKVLSTLKMIHTLLIWQLTWTSKISIYGIPVELPPSTAAVSVPPPPHCQNGDLRRCY